MMNLPISIKDRLLSSVLLLAILTLLVGRSVHVFTHDNTAEHSLHSCCTSEQHDEQSGEPASQNKTSEHSCPICDYVVSKFVVSDFTFLDFYTQMLSPTFVGYMNSEYNISMAVGNSRAPPYAIS